MTDSRALWEWLADAREGVIERRTVLIVLRDTVDEETWRWELTGAYPIRWAGPDLQADQPAVAIETLELAHQGFTSIG
jgi:phage tail-like protein